MAADPLYDLLSPHFTAVPKSAESLKRVSSTSQNQRTSTEDTTKYLSRLCSLSLSDLTNNEPQSLSQSSHSNLLSIQALSSRSHRSTTASSDRLATLSDSLSSIERSTIELRTAIPGLDESTVGFTSNYGRSKIGKGAGEAENASTVTANSNEALKPRKDSQLLARQAEKLQDILELPALLRASIAAASSSSSGSSGGAATGQNNQPSSASTASTMTNYTQALDLFTHIRRLQILYPDSQLIRSLQHEAELAMHEMTSALLSSLRSQNIRLAAAIRTIGWLRRVMPQLSSSSSYSLYSNPSDKSARSEFVSSPTHQSYDTQQTQDEDLFGPLFLVSRLSTFLSITTEALAPLRDLADQETEKRLAQVEKPKMASTGIQSPPSRRPSSTGTSFSAASGQQTERYLKRYIEVFREHSFSTVQMYRNIFPQQSSSAKDDDDPLQLPSAVSSFPLHLVSLLMETLQNYLPNVTDPAARESLLMQVLYAANSLGRLGADFSVMIALLELPDIESRSTQQSGKEIEETDEAIEPEWSRVIKKHKIQAARLDALSATNAT